MEGHTAGEWTVGHDGRPTAGSVDVNAGDVWIASVHGSHREMLNDEPIANFPTDAQCTANAALIAAAPTLLRENERLRILARAAFDILKKSDRARYVESAVTMTAFYDGADCDGYCLMQDIATALDIDENSAALANQTGG